MRTKTMLLACAIASATSVAHADELTDKIQPAFDLEHWMTLVSPEEVSSHQTMVDKPKGCLEAIASSGKPGSTRITLNQGELTLDEAKARCEKILADAQAFQDAVNNRLDGDAEAKRAKYAAVGMKGERLELFAYYDPMEWYLPGCTSSTDDPKKLKKAKKLFQWLTDSNGVITIRKFTFKGDRYKITEKTFYSEAKAYKGCR